METDGGLIKRHIRGFVDVWGMEDRAERCKKPDLLAEVSKNLESGEYMGKLSINRIYKIYKVICQNTYIISRQSENLKRLIMVILL